MRKLDSANKKDSSYSSSISSLKWDDYFCLLSFVKHHHHPVLNVKFSHNLMRLDGC